MQIHDQTPASSRNSKLRPAIIGVALATVLAVAVSHDDRSGMAELTGNVALKPAQTLVGQRIPLGKKAQSHRLILLSLEGCEPCIDAREYLALKNYAWVRIVPHDQISGIDFAPKSFPTLLVLNEKNIVTSEVNGWSDDPLWLEAFDYLILSNKPSEREETR